MKMNGDLSANPDAADPPAKTVPEALALPVAGAGGVSHRGRDAVVVVALRREEVRRSVMIAGAVIVALGMGGNRDDRNSQSGNGGKRQQ